MMVLIRWWTWSVLMLLLFFIIIMCDHNVKVRAVVGEYMEERPTWWLKNGHPSPTHTSRSIVASNIPTPSPTDMSGGGADPARQVVVQEEPYLSSTQVDPEPFKLYHDFYIYSDQHKDVERDTPVPATSEDKANLRNFAIPETIMKDGQIFYRHYAHVDGTIKGQSKRSHSRVSEEEEDEEETSDTDVHLSRSSQAQIEAHMGGGEHGGKAEALLHSGHTTYALGSAATGGFFSAEAQSVDEDGGMSQTQVLGNMHGVQGSAMTQDGGHRSHTHVHVGLNSSSKARISDQEDNTLLTSNVDATQVGGSAGAQAQGPVSSNSHAHMDFNPSQHVHDSLELMGHGLASAVVSQEDRSALVSLSGRVSGGRYLGTAHSSTGGTLAPHDDNPPHIPLPQDYILNEGMTHDNFSRNDFRLPVSNDEQSFEDDVQVDHIPTRRTHGILSHLRPVGQEVVELEGLVNKQVEERGHLYIPSGDPNLTAHTIMNHDMISNIMETVHQPHMVTQAVTYPGQEASSPSRDTVDDGGLTGGAGNPPRESEVGRAPQHSRHHLQEGASVLGASTSNRHLQGGAAVSSGASTTTSSRHDGKVGEVTYSHGRLGLPPGPGELLTNLPQSHYNLYDHSTSEYNGGDYNTVMGQKPPYFDLGPEIFSLEPIELSYEDLHPTTQVQHEDKVMSVVEPSLLLHQLQTTTPHLPSQAPQHIPPHLPSQAPQHLPPQLPSQAPQHASPQLPSQAPQHLPPQLPSQTPQHASPQLPSQAPQHLLPYLPSQAPPFDLPQLSQAPQHASSQPPSKASQQASSQPSSQASQQASSQPPSQASQQASFQPPSQAPQQASPQPPSQAPPLASSQLPSQATQQASPHFPPYPRLQTAVDDSIAPTDLPTHKESNGTIKVPMSKPVVDAQVSPTAAGDDGVRSIELVPGGPGTTVTLPGTTGGPVVNVLTMSASRATSLAQRAGTPIQPGQKIPGAPGYRVPPGFRGHVILGHDNVPVEADSRRVVEGFKTRVHVSPSSSSRVYASVSGAGASQPHAPPGVRVTLTDATTTTTVSRPLPETPPQVGRSQSTYGRLRNTSRATTQGKSCCTRKYRPSDDHGATRPKCRYYTITCRLVYDSYQEGRVCQPLLTCCC
ncbi:uncharacterized protein [Panulirus ornatus]|uniref:uncharacterized protein n=1 Tax=Panulirus ornatus TaxID=150431 RepID=UPI003A88D725